MVLTNPLPKESIEWTFTRMPDLAFVVERL